MHTYICICVCMYVCMHIHMYVCMHVCICMHPYVTRHDVLRYITPLPFKIFKLYKLHLIPMKCCITGENFIRLLEVSIKLFKFEIQKCGQIVCT